MTFLRNFKRLMRDVNSLERIPNLEGWLERVTSEQHGCAPFSSLDLGCGCSPKNPFQADLVFGIDLEENKDSGIFSVDLARNPIPFEDSSFNYVTAYDFIEHVPRLLYAPNRRFAFVELVNEVSRVLKGGGLFFSYTPLFPFDEALRDPTHVNFVTAKTFPEYFGYRNPIAKMYGFTGHFDKVDQAIIGSHLVTVMRRAREVK